MSANKVLDLITEHDVEFVDLRFADMLGVHHHMTFPAHAIDESTFEDGKMFDGSSITGWKGINESDMVLLPDPDTAHLDPFSAHPQLIMHCDVLEPRRCRRTAVTRARSPSAARRISNPPALPTPRSSARSRSFSSSIRCAGRTTWATRFTKSVRRKAPGVRATNTKAATTVIAPE